MNEYQAFLERKCHTAFDQGIQVTWMPSQMFPFQQELTAWALRRGRAALFADTGLGKSLMQLVFAENVVRQTNGRVLIVAPLAVSYQMQIEAEKFGIPCHRSSDGTTHPGITVTNYERIHHFNSHEFVGVCCDESAAIKHFGGVRQRAITTFLRKIPYRLLCSATPAPNDYIELGTSSEALGELGYVDMLQRFFKNDRNNANRVRKYGHDIQWRFRGHAEEPFWQWVCSWARAIRKPSDLGGDDRPYQLPPLILQETVIPNTEPRPGMLLNLPAVTLDEQRAERRMTLKPRCEHAAKMVAQHDRSIVWCHLLEEGDYLARIIPHATQIKGSDDDGDKESVLIDFIRGNIPVLVSKPSICGLGLNFQICAHMTMFPSHSFLQFYQSIRRCWRFGQMRSVHVDMITTEGELGVLKNLQRKADAAEKMYDQLIARMYQSATIDLTRAPIAHVEMPQWLTR